MKHKNYIDALQPSSLDSNKISKNFFGQEETDIWWSRNMDYCEVIFVLVHGTYPVDHVDVHSSVLFNGVYTNIMTS